MIEAHTFQEQYTGIQIFVFHAKSKEDAQRKFAHLVLDSSNWLYCGIKQVTF